MNKEATEQRNIGVNLFGLEQPTPGADLFRFTQTPSQEPIQAGSLAPFVGQEEVQEADEEEELSQSTRGIPVQLFPDQGYADVQFKEEAHLNQIQTIQQETKKEIQRKDQKTNQSLTKN